MGRGRGKGKKSTVISTREDAGSGEEEKIPVRRRGRPQKPLKDEIEEEEEEAEKIEEGEDAENTQSFVANKTIKNQAALENGRKRKRPLPVKENPDSVKEENGAMIKTSSNDFIKSAGFRQNGSRRKNKPRRAAEVGVECR